MFRVDPDSAFQGPHQSAEVLQAGASSEEAAAAMVLIHGRGATPESILQLVDRVGIKGYSYLAPRARGHSWYPWSFLKPLEMNQPGLDSALQLVCDLLKRLEEQGVPKKKVVLAGFSQGACLVSEFSARHPARYGGVVALSGGLIGDRVEAAAYSGTLDGTPVFMGCSDIDPHIPLSRVEESAAVFEKLKANLTKKIYPGMGHAVNEDELDHFRQLARSVLEAS